MGVFFFKSKADVVTILTQFFSLILTQFDKKIKYFWSDNALELDFYDFFRSQGVVYFHSCIATP